MRKFSVVYEELSLAYDFAHNPFGMVLAFLTVYDELEVTAA
jgi:hypothetical protein